MEATAVERRIIIAVKPRLLADTLLRALERTGVRIVISVDGTSTQRHYDVAVVMESLPRGVSADAVITLPADGGPGEASVTTAEGTAAAGIADLPALVDTLDHYLRVV